MEGSGTVKRDKEANCEERHTLLGSVGWRKKDSTVQPKS